MLSRARRILEKKEDKDPLIDLSGSSLEVYMALMSSRKPLTIREIQRLVGFKSPNSVRHHLEKLISMGYVKRSSMGYVAVRPKKSLLDILIVFRGLIIPRQFVTLVITLLLSILYYVSVPPMYDPVATIVIATIDLLVIYDFIKSYLSLRPLIRKIR